MKTPVWQLPYPALNDPADIMGVDGVDDLAARLEVVLTQLRAAGAIPGEMKMWSGSALPDLATYGHWVWADGTSYSAASYPLAAGAIAPAWKTHGGKADPGAGNFRVPDLRGQTPVGLDAMPGGPRANRIIRAAAGTIAAITGEEVHSLAVAEIAAHAHGVNEAPHNHGVSDPTHRHTMPNVHASGGGFANEGSGGGNINVPYTDLAGTGISLAPAATGVSIQSAGGGGAHENLPPTTFVPYIVKLDD